MNHSMEKVWDLTYLSLEFMFNERPHLKRTHFPGEHGRQCFVLDGWIYLYTAGLWIVEVRMPNETFLRDLPCIRTQNGLKLKCTTIEHAITQMIILKAHHLGHQVIREVNKNLPAHSQVDLTPDIPFIVSQGGNN